MLWLPFCRGFLQAQLEVRKSLALFEKSLNVPVPLLDSPQESPGIPALKHMAQQQQQPRHQHSGARLPPAAWSGGARAAAAGGWRVPEPLEPVPTSAQPAPASPQQKQQQRRRGTADVGGLTAAGLGSAAVPTEAATAAVVEEEEEEEAVLDGAAGGANGGGGMRGKESVWEQELSRELTHWRLKASTVGVLSGSDRRLSMHGSPQKTPL